MYSLDFRKLAIKLSRKDGLKETCRRLKISRTTIWRWKQNISIKKRKPYMLKKFELYKNIITEFIESNPCCSQRKMGTQFHISKNTLSRYIKMLKYSRKRTQKRGICKSQALPQLIQSFKDRYNMFGKENIICIDECGFCETLRPPYGYSKQRVPLVLRTSGGWSHYSLLLAIFHYGRVEYFVTQGGVNKEMFINFLENLNISENEAVLMDNASIHHKLTLQSNINIIYTPPYSPEYNAIELCFSQIKQVYKNKFVTHKKEVESTIIDSIFEGLNTDKIEHCYNHVDKIIKKSI